MDEVSESKFVSLLERSLGAWVHLACHHWVACCPSLDWEQRLHSEKKNNTKTKSQRPRSKEQPTAAGQRDTGAGNATKLLISARKWIN